MVKKKKRVPAKQQKTKRRNRQKAGAKPKAKKRLKLRYDRILLVLLGLGVCVYLFVTFVKLNIRNIYIQGNSYLSDQDVIEKAGIAHYPSTFQALCIPVKQKLERDMMIQKATVTKKGLFEIHINIIENPPLFYNKSAKHTVLKDQQTTTKQYQVPILMNYVPDKIYQRFTQKMSEVDLEILRRISEIEYKPNDVDKNRFLLVMQDGNYVYLTLDRFRNINNYVEIIRKFEHKKGILYLDSGEYFKVFEG